MAMCLFHAKPAQSVPAFARRTGQECQACHFRPPELNIDGQDFLRRGLREEPPEKPTKCLQPAEGGQPVESEQPVDFKLPVGVPLQLKWADYLSAIGHHDFVAETGVRPYFDAGGIDLWIAGPIDMHWTGLVNPSFDIQNGGADVDSGYGMYVSQWANEFISSRFGQRLPYAILLNQGGPSLTLSTPIALSTPADTGNTWTPTSFLRSVEVGGVWIPRWNVYFSAGNPRLDDSQTSLPGFEDSIDLSVNAEYFPGFLNSSISLYGYWGHTWLSPNVTSSPFHRAGAFFNIYGPQVKSTLGYIGGNDEAINDRNLNTGGGFALVEYLVDDYWSTYFRYDWFRQNLDAEGSRKISGPVFGASYWAATQIWLTVELQFLDISDQRSNNIVTTELNWAF